MNDLPPIIETWLDSRSINFAAMVAPPVPQKPIENPKIVPEIRGPVDADEDNIADEPDTSMEALLASIREPSPPAAPIVQPPPGPQKMAEKPKKVAFKLPPKQVYEQEQEEDEGEEEPAPAAPPSGKLTVSGGDAQPVSLSGLGLLVGGLGLLFMMGGESAPSRPNYYVR